MTDNFFERQLNKKDTQALESVLKMNKFRDGTFVEIGTWMGYSTSILSRNARVCGSKVITIDTFDGAGSHLEKVANENNIEALATEALKKHGCLDNVTIVEANSREYVHTIAGESLDLVFLDGDHRYSSISQDIDLWWPKIKNGGILCGHDYNGKVFKEEYIEQDFVEEKHHGVCKAVSERFEDVTTFEDSSIWMITK